MREVIRSSFLYNWIVLLSNTIAEKWNTSEIGWLFTRNFNDVKTRNSFFYKVINAPFAWAGTAVAKGRFVETMRGSVLLNWFAQFQYGVYALVLLAPFLPTMLCVALVVLTLFSFILNKILYARKTLQLDCFGFLLILLIGIFAFYSITSLAPVSSLKIWMVYAPFMIFTFLVMEAIDSKKELRRILNLFLAAGLLVSLYGIYQQFFGSNVGHAWLDNQMFEDIGIRVYSTFGNPNVLGEYLLLLIPLAVGMFWTAKGKGAKFYYLCVVGASALCMIFTQSRGCWLGLILAAMVYIILVDKRYILLVLLALMAMPFVMPESVIERFTSIGNLGDSSTSYRVNIWYGTFNMLRNFGLHGIGLGTDAFNQIYPIYAYCEIIAPHAHNIYLQILCESGIVGLGTFIIAMIVALKKLYVGFIADRKGFAGITCAAVLAGLLGLLLQGAFDYIWYNYRVFLLFWMVIGIGLAARRLACDKGFSHHQ